MKPAAVHSEDAKLQGRQVFTTPMLLEGNAHG